MALCSEVVYRNLAFRHAENPDGSPPLDSLLRDNNTYTKGGSRGSMPRLIRPTVTRPSEEFSEIKGPYPHLSAWQCAYVYPCGRVLTMTPPVELPSDVELADGLQNIHVQEEAAIPGQATSHDMQPASSLPDVPPDAPTATAVLQASETVGPQCDRMWNNMAGPWIEWRTVWRRCGGRNVTPGKRWSHLYKTWAR